MKASCRCRWCHFTRNVNTNRLRFHSIYIVGTPPYFRKSMLFKETLCIVWNKGNLDVVTSVICPCAQNKIRLHTFGKTNLGHLQTTMDQPIVAGTGSRTPLVPLVLESMSLGPINLHQCRFPMVAEPGFGPGSLL